MPIRFKRPRRLAPGIRQDGPKRFVVRKQWIDPKTGRRRNTERVFTTFAAAAAFRDRPECEPVGKPTRVKFRDYAEQWVKRNGRDLAFSSKGYYANNVAHASVGIGDIYLDALEPKDIRQWMYDYGEGYAQATVDGWHRVVGQVLDDAVEDGLIRTNPARFRRKRKGGKRRKKTGGARGRRLSKDEFIRFLEAIRNAPIAADVGRALLAVAWTGCRFGEVVALRWEDYVGDELLIRRSVFRGHLRESTKTGEDEDDPRVVWVVEPLAEALREQRQWLLGTQHPALETGLIFPARPRHAQAGAARRGEGVRWYRSNTTLRKALDKVLEEAKLDRITVHSLRRTIENLERHAGVEALVRRSSRGWVTEAAQEIYTEVGREDRQVAGDVLLSYLFAAGDSK